MSLASQYNSAEYRAAARLMDDMDSRWFSADVFSQALIDLGGRNHGTIFQIFSLYLDNMAAKVPTLDFSEMDVDTIDALDRMIRMHEVLTRARQDGRL